MSARTRTPPSPSPRSCTARNAAYIEDLLRPLRGRPGSVDAAVAGLLREPEGRSGRRSRRAREGAVLEAAELAAARQRRTGRRARRQLGARSRRSSATRSAAKAQARRRRAHVRADVHAARRAIRVRALMLIRAYRMRGHLHANLDPLGLEPSASDHEELDPALLRLHRSRHGPQDLHRQRARPGISRRCARSSRSCARTYCGTIGVEFMHISDPRRRRWIQERIEGTDKEITFTREGKRAILNKLVEAEGFEKFLRRQVHRHQALRPRRRRGADPGARADHQARRQARREGDRHRHGRIAAG